MFGAIGTLGLFVAVQFVGRVRRLPAVQCSSSGQGNYFVCSISPPFAQWGPRLQSRVRSNGFVSMASVHVQTCRSQIGALDVAERPDGHVGCTA